MSDPGPHGDLVDQLPSDPKALAVIVQGLAMNLHTAHLYDLTLDDERRREAQSRTLQAILAQVLVHDGRPLDQVRPPADRFVGTCRDFTLLLCAFLRAKGVPARARCGFGSYFLPGHFEDHWVCEHWVPKEQRWVLSDAQIDPLQRNAHGLDFDPLDVPRDRFLVAGHAWQLCRSGAADPALFGILDMRGLYFVRDNVVRDLAALNRVELLPWDGWGLMLRLSDADDETAAEVGALLDQVAEATRGEILLDSVRKLYEAEPDLRVPPRVFNFQMGQEEPVPTS